MAKKSPKSSASEETEAAYRKRAETAPLEVSEGEWKETIMEAVYWPQEGSYGGGTSCKTREEALDRARGTMKLGYGIDPAKHVVHIVETRRRVVVVSLADMARLLDAP
jgi:hypothetical protein